MRLERHDAVVTHDLPGIYAYIARDNPDAAERVLEAVDASFTRLTAQPECGVPYPGGGTKMAGVRMLPVGGFRNYLIFYRTDGEVVRVLHVVHAARHLPRLLRRDVRQ